MQQVQKYLSKVSALQFIQLLRFATLFLLGVIFVRYYSKSEIGVFEAFIFFAGAVSFFWLSGILQSFQRLVNSSKYSQGTVFYNGALILFVFSMLLVITLLVLQHSFKISNSYLSDSLFHYFLLYIVLSSPANLVEYIYLGKGQTERVIAYGSITYLLQFLLMGIPAIIGLPLLWVIKGLVGIAALRFIWLVVLVYKNGSHNISTEFIKEHLHIAWPLIGSAFLSGSAQYIDGLIVTHYFNEAAFAIFRYGARELPLALILASALSNAMIPEFSTLPLSEALGKLKHQVSRLMHLLFPITFVLLLCSNWLYPRIFNPDFLQSAKIFNVYLLLIVSRVLLPNTILIGLGRTKPLLLSSFIEIVVNVSLSIYFIQIVGLRGVAIATVIAYSLDKLVLMLVVWRKTGIKPSSYIAGKQYLLYAFLLLAIYIFVDFYLYT